jgi:hypothetical protein
MEKMVIEKMQRLLFCPASLFNQMQQRYIDKHIYKNQKRQNSPFLIQKANFYSVLL